MKVLMLTDADVFAGTERHIFDLACALREQNIEVRVACPVPSPLATQCEHAQVRVLDIPKRGFIDWNAVRVLRRQLKLKHIDIIHAHNGRTALASALAVSGARRGKLVATQHFLAPNRTTQSGIKAKMFGAAHRLVGKKTSANIAISQAVCDAMVARGEEAGEIAVVRNGIPDVAQRARDDGKSVRHELKLGDLPFVFCAARLEAEKDVESLIDAMKSVVKTHAGAQCLIAGEGALHNELQQKIDQMQLKDNVRLLGFREDVLSLMRACDVFVLPSLAEPFGLVIIEAMALGKPVIATDAGGPREIVQNGESGFLVAPSSPHELADALLKLLGDENARAQMGQKSRARYEECFTAKRMAQQIADLYRKVV